MDKNNILGVEITNASKSKVLEFIFDSIRKKEKKCIIFTPNPEIIIYAKHHSDFRHILNQATIALPDGIGITLAAKILGISLKGRLPGTDMMEMLCEESSKRAITVGFLGGRGKIAEQTAKCLKKRYKDLIVLVAEPGDPTEIMTQSLSQSLKKGVTPLSSSLSSDIDSNNMIESEDSVKEKSFHELDILFVAYGFPKQEVWTCQASENLPVRVIMTVGGAFDYISGNIPRAPKIIRAVGFEWLYRLVRQPWRIKRQLALFEFVLVVIKERFRNF